MIAYMYINRFIHIHDKPSLLVSICCRTMSAQLYSELLMKQSFLPLSELSDFPSHRVQIPPVLSQNLHQCCDIYGAPATSDPIKLYISFKRKQYYETMLKLLSQVSK